MVSKEAVAILGLVGAIAILGGAFTHTIWLYTLQLTDKETLLNQYKRAIEEKEDLANKIRQMQDAGKQATPYNTESREKSGSHVFKPTTIVKGLFSKFQEETNIVFENESHLEAIINNIGADVPSNLDFTSSTIVGVFYGSKPNLCYDVKIDKVEIFKSEIQEELIITVLKTKPVDDSICPPRQVNPFHIVSIPIKADRIQFIEKIDS